ncbi:glycosyltransferase [Lichenicola sp.]|uniref:glycosyltransferase n=1 Tax=Lichenicola sp. TaxID=2804529 RepID=UPI003B00E237
MDIGERVTSTGCIDFYGYAVSTGGWLLCGWAATSDCDGLSGDLSGQHTIRLLFEFGTVSGEALVVETVRTDLGNRGRGVAVHLSAGQSSFGALRSAELDDGGGKVVMRTTSEAVQLHDAALVDVLAVQPIAWSGETADRLRVTLKRAAFDGRDTLDRFEGQFAFRIDDAVSCGASDILMNGWLMTASPGIRGVRLRSGRRSTPLQVRDAIRVSRPDVVAEYGNLLRSRNTNCGFVLHVADCIEPGNHAYIEIETVNGETGFVRLKPSRLRGLHAIRNTLANLSPRYDEVQTTFDIIGPALSLLNQERLDASRTYREICFGTPPTNPTCSVIVPIYGRIDYMEVQVALLAQGQFAHRHELIYVIDDPDGADTASYLADSLFRRFGLPLRLLLLEENVGFAPASNAGLSVAQGSYVCFLNSDVFSLEPDWLDALLDDFARHPSVGIVGPLLLFEDGTIQHQGMRYDPLPEFSHWLFPTHPGKGSRPNRSRTLALHPAITGACMVMPRQLALDLEGFDESYIIGDFEDSDLCLRAREFGAACAVDHGVVLYHLERKSQASAAERWRMNVTLYNAWLHQRRWAARLNAEAARVSEPDSARDRTILAGIVPLLAGQPLHEADVQAPGQQGGASRPPWLG